MDTSDMRYALMALCINAITRGFARDLYYTRTARTVLSDAFYSASQD